jgi:hypothetical protein
MEGVGRLHILGVGDYHHHQWLQVEEAASLLFNIPSPQGGWALLCPPHPFFPKSLQS